MDKYIEKEIYEVLKDRNYLPDNELYKAIDKKLNCTEPQVSRVVNLMKDRLEIGTHPTVHNYLRLTDVGIKSHKPKKERILSYIASNWIAIVGAVTGIIGTVTGIIALTTK